MVHIEGEIVINRTPEEMFDFVADERNPKKGGPASDPGQLRRTQAPRRAGLATPAPAVPPELHSGLLVKLNLVEWWSGNDRKSPALMQFRIHPHSPDRGLPVRSQ